jgi:hypothetical protein
VLVVSSQMSLYYTYPLLSRSQLFSAVKPTGVRVGLGLEVRSLGLGG